MEDKKHGNYKHGLSGRTKKEDPIYACWKAMKSRCINIEHAQFKDYGARGITICDDWMEFSNFYRDMGNRHKGMSLDRIDNNGPYCKDNCRWANQKEQSNNRRSTKIYVENGLKKTWSEKVEESGLTRDQFKRMEFKKKAEENGIKKRIKKGVPQQKAKGASRHKDDPFHSLYKSWDYMKSHHAGMDERWRIFINLCDDMGPKPEGKRLLRKDTSLPFSKENCYWG